MVSDHHRLAPSPTRTTAAVRQGTDTGNYPLPAQSTLRMAGIPAERLTIDGKKKHPVYAKKKHTSQITHKRKGLWLARGVCSVVQDGVSTPPWVLLCVCCLVV